MSNRHFAKNVSADFARTRQAIRDQLDTSHASRSENRRWKIEHDELIDGLVGPHAAPDVREQVDRELQDVEATYLTLMLTTDQSVRVKEVHDEIGATLRRIKASVRNLADPERDRIVRVTQGIEDDGPIPSTLDAFEGCQTIAERAAVARSMLQKVQEDLAKVEFFFDYKRGFSGPGKPTKYALVYLVFALAELFERVGWQGKKAYIVNGPPPRGGRRPDEAEQLDFEAFTFQFQRHIDEAEVLSQRFMLAREQLRSLTERVHRDPDLHRLLGGDPPNETVLQFIERADVIKRG
jgi:phage baseplate assembly protein W